MQKRFERSFVLVRAATTGAALHIYIACLRAACLPGLDPQVCPRIALLSHLVMHESSVICGRAGVAVVTWSHG